MSIHDFLDKKHGKFIGRVYMLMLLFACNALIPIGAVLYYMQGMSPATLIVGIAGTVFCWGILSTPTKLSS